MRRLTGLLSQEGLEGCVGTVIKFDRNRRGWHVELSASHEIVVAGACNLTSHAGSTLQDKAPLAHIVQNLRVSQRRGEGVQVYSP